MTISRNPLTLALSLKGRGNGVCIKYSPSPLAGEGGGEGGRIQNKYIAISPGGAKMLRAFLLNPES
jgi:hypothetical protein